MQQNRDRNGRPRNTRPYDLNRDVARTSAPSQDHTPRSTGSSRYGYNGEPLSRPPSRSANGSVRSSRADNSIQFPTQSQPRRPAQGQGSNMGSFAPCEQRTFCKGTVAADDFFNASEWCGDSCAGDRDAFFAHKAERRKLLHRA